MTGLGKHNLYTKFEVAGFSHCVNIEGEPPNYEELPQSMVTFTFSFACAFMITLGKPQLRAKFEIASFSSYRNIIY